MTTKIASLGLLAVVAAAACSSKDPLLNGHGGGGTAGTASAGAGGTAGSSNGGTTGSGGTTGAGGTASGGTTGTGGGTGCQVVECLRPYECVRMCGGPIVRSSCCPCAAPTFDNFQNMACGGAGGGGGAGATGGAGGATGTGGGGGTGGNTDAGADTRLCEQALCTRPYVCKRSCGAPAEYTGCCMCEPPLFDDYQGRACGDGGTIACGTVTCGAGDVCVRTQTVGGAQILPTDGGCPPGTSLSGATCQRDPTWACATRPTSCGSALTCTCATGTLCTSGYTCTMPVTNQINCTLLAP